MAAPALAVDWEAVKAHALTHGAREAARAYGISENTVLWRSANEGWFANAGKAVIAQPLPKSMQPRPIKPISASEAAERTKASLGEKTRSRFARGIARGALKVAHMKGDTVLERASEIKQLVDAGAKLHGWGSESGQSPMLSLTFLGAAPAPDQAESAVIDVDSPSA